LGPAQLEKLFKAVAAYWFNQQGFSTRVLTPSGWLAHSSIMMILKYDTLGKAGSQT
jgi:hypothetical protein